MKKKIIISCIIIFIIIAITLFFMLNKNSKNKESATKTTDDINIKLNTDDGDKDINWDNYKTEEISLTKSITIKNEGIYYLTGTIENGNVTINTSGNVKLILNNIKINNNSGPALLVSEAENVVIELKDGSENYLSDGSSYNVTDEDINATLFSKDDLILQGEGTLNIKANYQDGIVSKDDLKIINGVYNIEAKGNGIRGKDSIYILDGAFNIETGNDAIKSTNDTDEEKGFIKIENGNFELVAENDGIQAETKLLIQNGDFNIKTGNGGNNSYQERYQNWNSNTSTGSIKGIKANDNLVIENGSFIIDSEDDAIHSNSYIGIKNGKFNINSGDDGIHADTELIIDNGTIEISNSYEGIESSTITINNGTINITSLDDGINVAGDNDESSMNRPGANKFTGNSNNKLIVNGGTINVDASGDGLDANGSIYINGGTIFVDGPTNSGNGTLDYDDECVVTDGTIIALGASGMAQGFSESSTQVGALININTNYQSGTTIKLLDENSNIIISYTSKKSFSSIAISSNKMQKSKTYTLQLNDATYTTFETKEISTIVGNSGMSPNGKPSNMNEQNRKGMPNGEKGGRR